MKEDRRKYPRDRRANQERHYVIKVSTSRSPNEFLTAINGAFTYEQAHIYDFGKISGQPIHNELDKLMTNYRSHKIDAPQDTEKKGD